MPDRIRVSTVEFVRNIGLWQERALEQPVSITHHGRERLVLVSHTRFEKLMAGGAGEGQAAALSQAISSFHALVEHLPDAFILLDDDFRILLVNRATETYFGTSRNQLVGEAFTEGFPRIIGTAIDKTARIVRRTREPAVLEADSALKDGVRLKFWLSPHPEGTAVIARNVTEQVHLTQEVDRLRGVGAAARAHPSVAVIELDGVARCTAATAPFGEWTGFSQGDLARRPLTDILSPQDRAAWRVALEAVYGAQEVRTINVTFLMRKGDEMLLSCAISPIVEGLGVIGAVVMATRI